MAGIQVGGPSQRLSAPVARPAATIGCSHGVCASQHLTPGSPVRTCEKQRSTSRGVRMIETPSLVDQYCHGVLRTELGLGTFEAQLARTEGPPAAGHHASSTPRPVSPYAAGARPLLGLEPHCTARPLSGPAPRTRRYWSRAADCCAAAASRTYLRRHRAARRPHRARRAGLRRGRRGPRDRPPGTARRTGRRHLRHRRVLPRQPRRVRARGRRERRGLHLRRGR